MRCISASEETLEDLRAARRPRPELERDILSRGFFDGRGEIRGWHHIGARLKKGSTPAGLFRHTTAIIRRASVAILVVWYYARVPLHAQGLKDVVGDVFGVRLTRRRLDNIAPEALTRHV